jgi:hypothetical protein
MSFFVRTSAFCALKTRGTSGTRVVTLFKWEKILLKQVRQGLQTAAMERADLADDKDSLVKLQNHPLKAPLRRAQDGHKTRYASLIAGLSYDPAQPLHYRRAFRSRSGRIVRPNICPPHRCDQRLVSQPTRRRHCGIRASTGWFERWGTRNDRTTQAAPVARGPLPSHPR